MKKILMLIAAGYAVAAVGCASSSSNDASSAANNPADSVAVAAPAAAPAPALSDTASSGAPAAVGEEVTFTASAPIVAIDKAKRAVTVQTDDGSRRTFKVRKSVNGFDQLKVGDIIVVRGFEAVIVGLKGPKSGPAGVQVDEETLRSAKGHLPADAEVEQVRMQSKIVAINWGAPSVSIQDPEGKVVTLKAKPQDVQGLQVGDDIEIVFVEGFAVAVEPPVKNVGY